MSNGIFGLTNDEFWSDPEKGSFENASSFAQDDRIGVWIDAPTTAALDTATLPIALMDLRPPREHAQIEGEEGIVLVAVRHDDNALFVTRPLVIDKTPEPTGPPPPPPSEGLRGEYYVIDAIETLRMSVRRGAYTVFAMLRERISNTCRVSVGPGEHEVRDDVPEGDIEDAVAVDPVWPPASRDADTDETKPYPSWRAEPQSPEMPAQEGVSFIVDRVAEPGGGRRCMLRGAFRLPAGRYERVEVGETTGELSDVGCVGATAVVTIHIVATGTLLVGPFVFALRAPSFDPLPEPGGLVTGYFNIDLFDVDQMPVTPGTYFLTALSRGVVRGPAPLGMAPNRDGTAP